MALNLDNERRYLQSLLLMGGGKAIWARQQAKKYGISLEVNTYAPPVYTQPVQLSVPDEPRVVSSPRNSVSTIPAYMNRDGLSDSINSLNVQALIGIGALVFIISLIKK
jgi:hypothetical protein